MINFSSYLRIYVYCRVNCSSQCNYRHDEVDTGVKLRWNVLWNASRFGIRFWKRVVCLVTCRWCFST